MGAMLRLLSLRRAKSLRRPGPQGHETAVPVSSGSRQQPVGTSHSVSTIQGEKDEAHLIPAHVVLATLVHRQLLPAVLAVRSAAQLPQTQAKDAALQEQEKIVCLTLDLIHSLGFDEEDCLKVLRGFIRAIDETNGAWLNITFLKVLPPSSPDKRTPCSVTPCRRRPTAARPRALPSRGRPSIIGL